MLGKYIVIEGPPGSGKTTQLRLLRDYLTAKGYSVVNIADLVKQSFGFDHLASQQLELLAMSTKQSEFNKKAKLLKEQGIICLADENYLSTLTTFYYGEQSKESYEAMGKIIEFATGNFNPDLTIVLDATPTILSSRQSINIKMTKNGSDHDYLNRIRTGYLWEAKQRELPIVSSDGTPDQTFEEVKLLVESMLTQLTELKLEEPVTIGNVLKAKKFKTRTGQIAKGDINSGFVPEGLNKEMSQSYKQSSEKIQKLTHKIRLRLQSNKASKNLTDEQISDILKPLGFWKNKTATIKPNVKLNTNDFLTTHSVDNKLTSLGEYYPKNELDLLPDFLYGASDLTLQELKTSISDWSYNKKTRTLAQLASAEAGLGMSKQIWDVLCNRLTAEAISDVLPNALSSLAPTPRYGYDTPEEVDSAGCSDFYDECFDESLSLYSSLQSAGYIKQASQATLLGHKGYHKLSTSLADIVALRNTSAKSSNLELIRVVESMLEAVSRVYPVIGSAVFRLKSTKSN